MTEHKRAADTIATLVLSALAALTAAASVMFSWFFVMATDSCGSNNCDEAKLGHAYGWTWGGVAVAALVGVIGVLVAHRRGRTKWIWPALALLIIIATFAVGAQLAAAVPTG